MGAGDVSWVIIVAESAKGENDEYYRTDRRDLQRLYVRDGQQWMEQDPRRPSGVRSFMEPDGPRQEYPRLSFP